MRCLVCGAKNKPQRTTCAKCASPLDTRGAAFGGAAHAVRTEWEARGIIESDDASTGKAEAEQAEEKTAGKAVPPVAAAAVAVACVGVLVAGCWLLGHVKTAGTPLTTAGFADERLVQELERYDENGDGYLSSEEASAVVELSLDNLGLQSLSGIEVFTNLEVLDAQGNDLTEVDLSALTHLRAVDLSDNALSELSLAGHEALLTLKVSNNAMTSLDLSGCTELQRLTCDGNDLARLDLSGCTDLTELALDPDQNVTLPISEGFFPDAGLRAALLATEEGADGTLTLRERESITSLVLRDATTTSLYGIDWICGLTELDVSGCPVGSLDAAELPSGLTKLTARACELTEVNLDGLEHLAELDLSNNPLTGVDLSELPRLTTLSIAGCNLKGALDLTANERLETLDVQGNASLERVVALGNHALEHEGSALLDEGCELVLSEEEPADEAPEEAGQEARGLAGEGTLSAEEAAQIGADVVAATQG